MPNTSFDPRIRRADLQGASGFSTLSQNEHWEPYAVFHQDKRGEQHVFVGTIHAPDAELALLFAKEQYGRRKKTVSIWVVKSTDIFSFDHADEDMYSTVPEKTHREASGYPVRKRINKYLHDLEESKQ